MTRNLLGLLALAASASIAAAQQPATHPSSAKAKRHTTTSTARGEVARNHGAAVREVAGSGGMAVRAVARDWVRADDTRGDDLYRREQMMDQKCGKNRERCGKP
jgi:hypothetical protein